MADQTTTTPVAEDDHEALQSVWDRTFPAADRDQMMSDDSLTWKHVILLLVAVVLVGVSMMALTVFWVASYGS